MTIERKARRVTKELWEMSVAELEQEFLRHGYRPVPRAEYQLDVPRRLKKQLFTNR